MERASDLVLRGHYEAPHWRQGPVLLVALLRRNARGELAHVAGPHPNLSSDLVCLASLGAKSRRLVAVVLLEPRQVRGERVRIAERELRRLTPVVGHFL